MQTKPIPDYITSQGLSSTIFFRFFSKIEYTESCWNWTSVISSAGYGLIARCVKGFPGFISAHRLSWIIHFGTIPEGMHVCHECDNRKCVNPAHLWLGTHQNNMDDMVKKGRVSKNTGHRGEFHPLSKLTWEKVALIRSEHSIGGVTFKTLADKYGVHSSNIQRVVHGQAWKTSIR